MAHITPKEAWNLLLDGHKQVYTKLGFFALGDAYLITNECIEYKGQIVLVEHRDKHQYNHWGYRCSTKDCKFQPTITSNGDDGYGSLKRKAPQLKIVE